MSRPNRHICIVIANLPAERDRRVIRECQSLEAQGYAVTVIAPRGDPDLRVLPGTAGTRLRPYPVRVLGHNVATFAVEFAWSFLCVAARLAVEVVCGRAHAVQVCNPPDVYWPLALLMRAIGRPWVFDHHDLCPEIYRTRAGEDASPLAARTLSAFEWLTLRTATAVVVTNASYRANALRRGVPPRRVVIARNGPRLSEIAMTGNQRADARPHRIVYLGVLGPQDNVEGAVLAAEALVARRGREDWRMIIAGDGECLPTLTKLTADRGLADVVEFTGWLQGSEVDTLLRHATVALQPDLRTRMNDLSTMAKTVEYVARGVPVVAVDLIETQHTAGPAAVYVPNGTPEEFAAAISDLLDDPHRREAMRLAGRSRFVETLAWERQEVAYLGLWRSVLPIEAVMEEAVA